MRGPGHVPPELGRWLRRWTPDAARPWLRRLAVARFSASLGGGAAVGLRRALGQVLTPPRGRVRFGDLRRTTPIACDFGYGRGGPVDRCYIEDFLERHSSDVRGRVLEVGDSSYTRRFGGDRVERADVLHVDAAAGTSFTGDIADPATLAHEVFDCIILTQTLHLVFDFLSGLRNVRDALAPGGVLLLTVPGISNVDPHEWGQSWYYSFTDHALRRMVADLFDGFDVTLTSHGNVLAAVAFLHGLGVDELTAAERNHHEVEYSLIHALRVAKSVQVASA